MPLLKLMKYMKKPIAVKNDSLNHELEQLMDRRDPKYSWEGLKNFSLIIPPTRSLLFLMLALLLKNISRRKIQMIRNRMQGGGKTSKSSKDAPPLARVKKQWDFVQEEESDS
jgi:hypothetical protein